MALIVFLVAQDRRGAAAIAADPARGGFVYGPWIGFAIGWFWTERLPRRTVRSITYLDLEPWVGRRAKEVSPATVNHEIGFLRRFYKWASSPAVRLAKHNPVDRSLSARNRPGRTRWLTPVEETKLFDELPAEAKVIVELAYHVGIRRGRFFLLDWSQVDLDRRGVRVIAKTPRGAQREYRVPLSKRAVELFKSLPSYHAGAAGVVFPNHQGRPMNAQNFYNRVYKPALERAGIKNLTFHDLRHTTGSRLRLKGAKLEDIAAVLGHADVRMANRYAHLTPEYLHQVADLLDQ